MEPPFFRAPGQATRLVQNFASIAVSITVYLSFTP